MIGPAEIVMICSILRSTDGTLLEAVRLPKKGGRPL